MSISDCTIACVRISCQSHVMEPLFTRKTDQCSILKTMGTCSAGLNASEVACNGFYELLNISKILLIIATNVLRIIVVISLLCYMLSVQNVLIMLYHNVHIKDYNNNTKRLCSIARESAYWHLLVPHFSKQGSYNSGVNYLILPPSWSQSSAQFISRRRPPPSPPSPPSLSSAPSPHICKKVLATSHHAYIIYTYIHIYTHIFVYSIATLSRQNRSYNILCNMR